MSARTRRFRVAVRSGRGTWGASMYRQGGPSAFGRGSRNRYIDGRTSVRYHVWMQRTRKRARLAVPAAELLQHPGLRPLDEDASFVLSEEQIGWFAGFVDGEGSIALTIHGSLRFVMATVSFANTNLDNVYRGRRIVSCLTGRDFPPRLARARWRPAFQVTVARHEDVLNVVSALRHRLVGKRQQAELMIDYLERCSLALRSKRRGADTPEEKALRHHYALRMQELNRRYGVDEWAVQHPEMALTAADVRRLWLSWPTRGLAIALRPRRALPQVPRVNAPSSPRRVRRHSARSAPG